MPSLMKPVIAALLGALLVPAGAGATESGALAVKAGCSACHSKDKKILGPAYIAIAEKYRADPNAASALAAKVRSGGKGVWGPLAMPPAPKAKVTDEELASVIGWILRH